MKLPAKGVSLIIQKLWARQFIKQGTVGTEQQQIKNIKISKQIAQREDGSLASYASLSNIFISYYFSLKNDYEWRAFEYLFSQ